MYKCVKCSLIFVLISILLTGCGGKGKIEETLSAPVVKPEAQQFREYREHEQQKQTQNQPKKKIKKDLKPAKENISDDQAMLSENKITYGPAGMDRYTTVTRRIRVEESISEDEVSENEVSENVSG